MKAEEVFRKVNIIKTIPKDSQEWYDLRNEYVGASEVGTILGINKWDTKKSLLLRKLGYLQPPDNINIKFGHLFEGLVANICEHYDSDIDTTINNFKEGKKIRNLKLEENGYLIEYVVDDTIKVPLIVTPDFFCEDEETQMLIPYEVKTTSKYVSEQAIDIAEPQHIWQNIMQQLVYGSTYGYVFTCAWAKALDLNKVEIDNYLHQIDDVFLAIYQFYLDIEKYKQKDIKDIVNEYEPDDIIDITEINSDKVGSLDTIKGDDEDKVMCETYSQLNAMATDINRQKETIKKTLRSKYIEYKNLIVDGYKITLLPKFSIKPKTGIYEEQ